jgi:hypothetical protein
VQKLHHTHGTGALSGLNQFRRLVRPLVRTEFRQAGQLGGLGAASINNYRRFVRHRATWWKSLVRLVVCSTCSGPYRAESSGRQYQGQKERGKLSSASCYLLAATCYLLLARHGAPPRASPRVSGNLSPCCHCAFSSLVCQYGQYGRRGASSEDPKDHHVDRRGGTT